MRTFISFLGKGAKQKNDNYDYNEAQYYLDINIDVKSKKTKYVQAAEIELLQKENIDKVLIFATEESSNLHFEKLKKEMITFIDENKIKPITISESMSKDSQWQWFEEVLNNIGLYDELFIDLMYGFRAAPIIISAALNFMVKSKKIKIQNVFYGVFEKNNENGSPIIDMKDFYVINDWADGVSRLIEDADCKKLIETANADNTGADIFQNKNFIDALSQLSDAIKNVEVNTVSQKAKKVFDLMNKSEGDSVTSRLLIDLISDKYSSLLYENLSEKYTVDYLIVQLKFIDILIEHKLLMQAFTAMRELIGSFSLVYLCNSDKTIKLNNSDGRSKRKYAEIFVNMLQYEKKEWKFSEETKKYKDELLPFYNALIADCEIYKTITELNIKDLITIRNGFDHAWTSKSIKQDIYEKSRRFNQYLKTVSALLIEKNIFKINKVETEKQSKNRIVIANAFSVSMLKNESELKFNKKTFEQIKKIIYNKSVYSIVGHFETAKFFSHLLNIEILFNREEYSLQENDILIVGTFNKRLPEGALLTAEKIKDLEITWWEIRGN